MVSNGTTLQYEEIELKFFYRSWVHGEYINKMGYENNLITHCIVWSQRAELNRRPTDYESVAILTNCYFH